MTPGRYEWRLQIDGQERGDWRAAFTVLQVRPNRTSSGLGTLTPLAS